jgi:hypothetical protein
LLQSPGGDVAKSRLSQPFAVTISGAEVANSAALPLCGALVAGVAIALATGIFVYALLHCFEPHSGRSPVAAALKNLIRRASSSTTTISAAI